MRLLHVIGSVDPAVGGPIEGIRQLAVAYKSMAIDAEVASLDDPASKHLHDFPLPVHPMGPTLLGHFAYSSRLHSWLRENHAKYDCIIVNGLWQYHGYAVRRALRKTGKPYVVFTHGMLDPWFKHQYPLKHLKKWLYWPWGEYRVLRDAAAVLFTSREEMLLARESFWLYKVKPVVVGYGTLGPNVDVELAARAFLDEHPHLSGKRVAVFLGRIHPKKGCDLLIEAFARTLALDPAWHLLMVGPDQVSWQTQLLDQARRLKIADRVTWTGMLSGERKWGAIGCSEIFVLPSHQENFGIGVAEALACGVPVLISNKINIWREVQSESAGLVAPDTLEGTEALLKQWMDLSAEERLAMRDRTLGAFRRHFDIHTNSKSIVAVVKRVSKSDQTALEIDSPASSAC
jgi:glycosyltransferase involved in cell wall biosynthesis